MEKDVQERFERIEKILEVQVTETAKVLDATGKLIVVGRTCLDSIQGLRATQEKTIQEMRELQRAAVEEKRELSRATDEKLNILIDTVDRTIRHRNGKE